MKTSIKPMRLAPLLLVCGIAQAYAAELPACAAANFDSARQLFTMNQDNTSLSFDHPLSSQLSNQQCLLTVLPRAQAARLRMADGRRGPGPNGASELLEGRYLVYLSNGGDGGSGGSARPVGGIGGGGGGGGAGAVQVRQEVVLTPGTYKLTLGAGGPGGQACRGTFGGGPGWAGSPTSITRVSDGLTIAGAVDADKWVRLSRYANDQRSGPQDGHGGRGPGKTAGGAGSNVDPGFETVAQAGTGAPGVAGPSGPSGTPGQGGSEEPTKLRPHIGGGGGGGAGLGDGGDGGGDAGGNAPRNAAPDLPPEVGGLGAGGGGGEGRVNLCMPGAPGGNGYIALRPM